MATTGVDTGFVGDNVRAAVDTKHHLIVAHGVTNIGNDRAQLATMAAMAAMAAEEIRACTKAGHTPLVPKPLASGAEAARRFGKQDFIYLPEADEYRCPAGQRLTGGSAISSTGWRCGTTGQQLRNLPDQGQVHDGPGAADQALEA